MPLEEGRRAAAASAGAYDEGARKAKAPPSSGILAAPGGDCFGRRKFYGAALLLLYALFVLMPRAFRLVRLCARIPREERLLAESFGEECRACAAGIISVTIQLRFGLRIDKRGAFVYISAFATTQSGSCREGVNVTL
jgi:hypothetical protein